MRSVPQWIETITNKQDNSGKLIYSLAFKPDGSALVVAAGNSVILYDPNEARVVTALKGHRDTVYCVAYAKDGKRFASGGADKLVIIWTSKGEGVLKYSHNDCIQALAYNPLSGQLASCAMTDFGLWSPEQKSVSKHKIAPRVTSCSWTNDGQFLALGLFNGQIVIRSKTGEDTKVRFERSGGGGPVWSLQWAPDSDSLAVVDATKHLSFFRLNGTQIGRDADIQCEPMTVAFVCGGQFLVIGGSDRGAQLYTREGRKLGSIASDCDGWVLSAAAVPAGVVGSDTDVVLGTSGGSVIRYSMTFGTVHGLYKERYVFRSSMTDAVVQHLLTGEQVRLRCRDLIKKLSVYNKRLAIQLAGRILVYEMVENGNGYRALSSLPLTTECNLLVVCAQHIVLCLERRLQCFNISSAVLEREWIMDSPIRYIKSIGGPIGKEGMLVGLRNGQVMSVFLHNPFPIQILKHTQPIRCLDMSALRKKVALVDDESNCLVYNIATKELLFQEPGATSIAWNTRCEHMLAYSSKDSISIKAGTFPAHCQKMESGGGFVVGFSGSRVFCLTSAGGVRSVEVPQSAAMYQYIEAGQLNRAYEAACLGVSENDWKQLAKSALDSLDLPLARKAYTRLRELRGLELITTLSRLKSDGVHDDVLRGDISAWGGQFERAARYYRNAGQPQRAVQMWTDLRMFSEAQASLGEAGGGERERKELLARKAEWTAAKGGESGDEAADMYWEAGDKVSALKLYAERRDWSSLARRSNELDKAEANELRLCARLLAAGTQWTAAGDALRRLGDERGRVQLLVSAGEWQQAIAATAEHPELSDDVYAPYARHLADKGEFDAAHEWFAKAGREEEARRVLETLAHNSVVLQMYEDSTYYFWRLSVLCLSLAATHGEQERVMLERYKEYESLCSMHAAYRGIHQYVNAPFTQHRSLTLFHMAHFLMNCLPRGADVMYGISRANVLYTLVQQCRKPEIRAYKLARTVYEELSQLKLQPHIQDTIEIGTLTIRAKPCADNSELEPLCFRCLQKNSLLNIRSANACITCRHPFLFTLIGFEILPLVHFVVADGISQDEAEKLVAQEPISRSNFRKSNAPSTDHLRLDDDMEMLGGDNDEMANFIKSEEESYTSSAGDAYQPLVLDRHHLKALKPAHVYIRKWPAPLPWDFYWTRLSDQSITVCEGCQNFFLTDDWVLHSLTKGHCPICHFVV